MDQPGGVPTTVLGAGNGRVKDLRRQLTRGGRQSTLVVVEGVRAVREALDAGIVPETIVVPESASAPDAIGCLEDRPLAGVETLVVRDHVFERLAPSVTPQPMLALVPRPVPALPEVLADDDVVLVLASVSDPGNVGTLVRVADAVDGRCVVTIGGADPWGDKAVRASAGSVLRIPVVQADRIAPTLEQLRGAGTTVVAADAHRGVAHTSGVMEPPVTIVLGSESHGLPEGLDDHIDHRVRIGMREGVESINVAMAGTLLAFEARRPRAR